ncbi:MAG: hypothetical protein FJ317_07170 [SAR202 cluster bacterium]|nr:hypothetical protein [SAR202 cluster bacterium]
MFTKSRIALGIVAALLVALLAAACTAAPAASPSPVPTQPSGEGTPQVNPSPTPQPMEREEVAAPIESVDVVRLPGGGYSLKIVSGLPSGCAAFKDAVLVRDGDTLNVSVINTMPVGVVACTMIYGYHETDIALDGLTPGGKYTVAVNGSVTNAFTVLNDERPMTIGVSPVWSAEVRHADGAYTLVVVSTLPLGSSCSKVNGFDIVSRYNNRFEVNVTHYRIDESKMDGPVACTADLPIVSTEIPLGSGLNAGEHYDVAVNGQPTNSFLARDPNGPAMTIAEAPIERIDIVRSEMFADEYYANVTYRQPRGSSCSDFNGYDVSRESGDTIQVTVTNLEAADPNAACTRDLPVGQVKVPLGRGFESGHTYQVVVNGVSESFTAQ